MDNASSRSTGIRAEILCHSAFWYGLLFATPLLVALNNRQDLPFKLYLLVAGLLSLFFVASMASLKLATLLPAPRRRLLASTLLAISYALAIQGNLLHPLADFGRFDGSIVDFRKFGRYFWLEWYGFLAGTGLLIWFFSRLKAVTRWLAWLPILSFTVLWLPAALSIEKQSGDSTGGYDASVFEFSSIQNLVHLLPDGLQSDIVEQVFAQNPELAEKFRGFTLYADHLGMYQGTAPALPALLTGKPFEFERGHSYDWITPFIEENSYQNQLADRGFKLDLVHIDQAYCISRARSCVSRPFSDWKSRGYARQEPEDLLYFAKLLADLSLYRLLPAYLKEKIHNQGEWMLADSSMDGASPWLDPVIREWTEHMRVIPGQPVYKWYHYIGTHKPPFWNSACLRQKVLARKRENFLGQAECVLEGIALLLEKLQSEGIYDQTAIIVSGDHGHDIAPRDHPQASATVALSSTMMGTARPALLAKPMGAQHPFQISNAQTSLTDIPALALHLSEAGNEQAWQPGGQLTEGTPRERFFYRYPVEELATWSAEPVSFDSYRVAGPVNDDSSWELLDIQDHQSAPADYPFVSYHNASRFFRGLKLSPNDPDKEVAWITQKQLAFLISMSIKNDDLLKLVITLHIPEWIGVQSFTVRVNDHELQGSFNVHSQSSFWQDVIIELPLTAIKNGNNFVSISFATLHATPDAPNLRVAALFKSARPLPIKAAD